MKLAPAIIVSAAFGLSGCVTASVTQQFAQPGDVVGPGTAFAEQDVKRFVLVNGTTGLRDQTIEISFSEDGTTAFVTQNFETHTLVWDGVSRYVSATADLFIDVAVSDVVRTGLFQETVGSGYFNGGNFVFGFQTDPAQFAAQTGTATYVGDTYLSARTPTLDGFADGTVNLSANFATATITGTMNIVDAGDLGADYIVPDTTITINPGNIANITGNQFTTDLDAVFATAPGDVVTIDQTGLTGNFYGVDAIAAGATYWATGMFNGEALYIEGAFSAD